MNKEEYVISRFQKDVARDPNDPRAYQRMGFWWYANHEYRKALDCYNTAITLAPRFAPALCARASFLANCPDPTVRNGPLAVQDAVKAVGIVREQGGFGADWQARMYLGALVDAHLAVGDLDTAIEIQRSLLPYAVTKAANRQVVGRLRDLEARRGIRTVAE